MYDYIYSKMESSTEPIISVDVCDICDDRWFFGNTSTNRTLLNCSSPCVLLGDKCYQSWEELRLDIEDFLQMSAFKIAFIVLYVLIFVIGIIGNSLVVLAVWRNKQMRTVTNIFLLNLAISDLLVILICLPPTLVEDIWETWYLGLVLCKGIKFFQKVSVFVSILSLTAIAVERYYAICHPLKVKSTVWRAKLGSVVIWALAGGAAASDLSVFEEIHTFPECFTRRHFYFVRCAVVDEETWKLGLRVTTALFFVLPLVVMAFVYVRVAITLWREIPGIPVPSFMILSVNGSDETENWNTMTSQAVQRRRTAKMLILIVIIFVICHCPVNVLMLLWSEKQLDTSWMHPDVVTSLFLMNHALVYINSSCNPVVYNFMSEKFRREFLVSFSYCRLSRNLIPVQTEEINVGSTTLAKRWSTQDGMMTVRPAIRNTGSKTATTQIF